MGVPPALTEAVEWGFEWPRVHRDDRRACAECDDGAERGALVALYRHLS